MSKIVATVLVMVALAPLGLAFLGAGCSSTTSAYVTGCTTYTPDAGATPNLTCAIGWSCTSNSTMYQITCAYDARVEYYECSCDNGSTTTKSIVVDPFICDGQGSLSTANMGCDFNIQMSP